jgi:imidazolonepropionase-like amidohydrolase
LLVGSDRGEYNSIDEAVFLVNRGFMTKSEVLQSLTKTTVEKLFVHRKIGEHGNGFEATFVVLDANPLENINHIRTVKMVVKRGHTLKNNIITGLEHH